MRWRDEVHREGKVQEGVDTSTGKKRLEEGQDIGGTLWDSPQGASGPLA